MREGKKKVAEEKEEEGEEGEKGERMTVCMTIPLTRESKTPLDC